MIVSAVTKEFGVLATDSAFFDTAQSKIQFGGLRLFYSSKYLMSFMGSAEYFAKLDKTKLDTDIPTLVIYMKDYLKNIQKEVVDKSLFCLFVLGVHKKLPTIVKFSNSLNFEPKYVYSNGKVNFSTGDSSNIEYMEKKLHKLEKKGQEISIGLLGEVVTRGIYNKAEEEPKKTIGGVVNVGCILNTGLMIPLSGIIPA